MRSFDVSALVALGLACLAGCGGATPTPATPTQDSAVVNLDARAPTAAKPKAEGENKARYAVKGPEDSPDPDVARAAALRDAAEFGKVGVLSALKDEDLFDIMMGVSSSGVGGSVSGGVAGGVVGGGVGGLGLRGVGVSAGAGGGTGIGLGSIGTIGHGGGTGSGFGYGYGYGSGSGSGNPVSGDSFLASPTGVVELGDSLTLGVSQEQAARALRDRLHSLRNCYAERPAGPNGSGGVTLRLVVGRDGRVVSSREIGSDFTDAPFVKCVSKVVMDAYLGIPAGGLFGVVETVVRFRPPLKK